MIGGIWCIHEHEEGTHTSREQISTEKQCSSYLSSILDYSKSTLNDMQKIGLLNNDLQFKLLREKHVNFLLSNISKLPQQFVSLDASRPWMIYWITHGLALLGNDAQVFHERIIDTLSHFQNPSGGFGGGPNQLTHGAPNFASILTLCEIGTNESLGMIDRVAMYNHLLSIRSPGGGFTMHIDGEIDMRSCYTALVVARLLNLLTPELIGNTAEYILSCQSYEGGFGGEPNNEAHGGYNFCAIASLLILQQGHRMDIEGQRRWLLHMQTSVEGGFRGRTNKLVDSCYSYWQGAAFPVLSLIERGLSDIDDCFEASNLNSNENLNATNHRVTIPLTSCSCRAEMNSIELQKYILHCAQCNDGGLRDKPGKGRDFYHTSYALSGLTAAQWLADEDNHQIQVYGDQENLLEKASCVYNISTNKVLNAISYFSSQTSNHEELVRAYQSRS
mmetsp:Transcript_5893/g.6125  ORF Transcript_5893/g.6125 Transcript_5893/m.6125 type:complete len:446 (+) Transcript_5893:1476-2813(+)